MHFHPQMQTETNMYSLTPTSKVSHAFFAETSPDWILFRHLQFAENCRLWKLDPITSFNKILWIINFDQISTENQHYFSANWLSLLIKNILDGVKWINICFFLHLRMKMHFWSSVARDQQNDSTNKLGPLSKEPFCQKINRSALIST